MNVLIRWAKLDRFSVGGMASRGEADGASFPP